MELNEIIELLLVKGGTVVMAVLFIWSFIEQGIALKEERNKNTSVLEALSKSNNNIAESLNLLKTSMDNSNSTFKQHDERAIESFNEIGKDLIIIKENIKK